MVRPPAQMQQSLAGDLLVLNQALGEPDNRQLLVVAARLAALYAMTTASLGETHEAVRWYRTAKAAADASGDRSLAAWVRGREVLRGDYDGYTSPDQVLAFVKHQTGLAEWAPVE